MSGLLSGTISCSKDDPSPPPPQPIVNAVIDNAYVNKKLITNGQIGYDIRVDSIVFHLRFSSDINLKELKRRKNQFQ